MPAPSATEHVYDAIIIGGGISGMSAAAYLHDHSTSNLLVLEARTRLGGRTHTLTTQDGYSVDVGGAYVGPTQNRILRVAHQLGVKTTLTYDSEVTRTKNVLAYGGNSRSEYVGVIPSVSPFALLDINYMLQQTERLRKQIDRLQPHLPPHSFPTADTVTMEQWISTQCTTPLAAELYRATVRSLFCVEPCEVSVQLWMSFIQSGYGTDMIIGVSGGAQERHFVGGSQQISEKLAERVGKERVLFNKVVANIDWNADKTAAGATETTDPIAHSAAADTVLVTCRDGSRYRTRRLIVAVSPALYSTFTFQPYFPLHKQPTARMYMGCIIKTVMRYSTPWWRESNYSGLMMQLSDTADSNDSDELPPPVGYTYDDCHDEQHDGAQPFYAIMGFVFGAAGRRWLTRTAAERKAAIAAQYATVFQCDAARHPVDYYEYNWNADEYSRGCYNAVMPPAAMTELRQQLRTPFAGVHFAGAETAFVWPGYMSGAVEAGERAAHEVLQALGRVEGEFVVDEPASSEWECQPSMHKSWMEQAVEQWLPSAETARYGLAAAAIVVASVVGWWMGKK